MPATEVTVRVPGKVNLQLSVGPRREDGFHDIATVFHAVALHDDVTVAVAPIGSGISLTCEGEGQGDVPLDSTNLAWQAVQLLADSVGIQANVQIRIHKHIPVAGGMAGGSADAAGALLASDALWNLGTPKNVLHDLAVFAQPGLHPDGALRSFPRGARQLHRVASQKSALGPPPA